MESIRGAVKRARTVGLFALALICHLTLLMPLFAQSSSGSVEIFFVPNSTRAISVSMATSPVYDFGPILVGSAAVANLPIVVKNQGNVATTLALQVSNQATDLGTRPDGSLLNQHWTLATSTPTGTDTFALFAVFQSSTSKPGNMSFTTPEHVVKDAPQCATATRYKQVGGSGTGVRLPAADLPVGTDTVGVWLNLYPPTRSSNLKPKRFTVTVTTGGCD